MMLPVEYKNYYRELYANVIIPILISIFSLWIGRYWEIVNLIFSLVIAQSINNLWKIFNIFKIYEINGGVPHPIMYRPCIIMDTIILIILVFIATINNSRITGFIAIIAIHKIVILKNGKNHIFYSYSDKNNCFIRSYILSVILSSIYILLNDDYFYPYMVGIKISAIANLISLLIFYPRLNKFNYMSIFIYNLLLATYGIYHDMVYFMIGILTVILMLYLRLTI